MLQIEDIHKSIDLHKCTCQAPASGCANVQNVPEAFHRAELPAPVTTPFRLLQRSQWNEAEPPERTIQFRVWRSPHTPGPDALNFGTFKVHFYAKLSLAHFLSSFFMYAHPSPFIRLVHASEITPLRRCAQVSRDLRLCSKCRPWLTASQSLAAQTAKKYPSLGFFTTATQG